MKAAANAARNSIQHNLTSKIEISAGQEKDIEIEFWEEFPARPEVVVTLFCPYGYPSQLSGTLKYVGTAGFTYCVKNSSADNLTNVRLSWIAIM